MYGEHHDLIHELPEHKERIHELKQSDPRFARLFDEYHEVDRELRRIQQEIETPADAFVEDLKKKRLQLKDALYTMLNA